MCFKSLTPSDVKCPIADTHLPDDVHFADVCQDDLPVHSPGIFQSKLHTD